MQLQINYSGNKLVAPAFRFPSFPCHLAATDSVTVTARKRASFSSILLREPPVCKKLNVQSRKRPNSIRAASPLCQVRQTQGGPLSKNVGLSEAPAASSLDTLLSRIRTSGIIACVKAKSPELALVAARAALDGGVDVLEVTMTTPSAIEVIRTVVSEYPEAVIGAGTVLTLEDAEAVVGAGARTLVSPVTDEILIRRFANGPALYIPGAMTPNEIVHAHSLGARAVKVFPVSSIGGVDFIRALQRPFSHIPLIPSQGIAEASAVRAYLDAGATAVVLSDYIFPPEAVASGDADIVRRVAMSTLQFRTTNRLSNVK